MATPSLIIDEAHVSIITAPLITPFRIATGQHDDLSNVFIRLRTSEGICGYGEAAVATHITGETVPETLANLRTAAVDVKGRRIDSAEELCREFAQIFERNHAGLAAFEMAVLDLWCRASSIPLYRFFSPAAAPAPKLSFASDITIVIGSVEEAEAAAKRFAAQGFNAFKIKIGRDEELDLDRILAVGEAAPGSQLILDANMAYSADKMLAFLERLFHEGVRPVLIEQPVPKLDLEGLKALTAALSGKGTLVCADESVGSLAEARRVIDSKAVSAINIKPMKSGFLEGAEIARLACESGISLMLGAMMESGLAITASAHFAAGLGCFDFIDLDTTFFIKGDLAQSPYLDDSGRFDLDGAGAGIGVEPLLP